MNHPIACQQNLIAFTIHSVWGKKKIKHQNNKGNKDLWSLSSDFSELWGLASSPRKPLEIAWSCTRKGSGWTSGGTSSWKELLNMRMNCPGWCSLYRTLHDVPAWAMLGSWYPIILELLHLLVLCNVSPWGTWGNFVCRRIILQISEEVSKIIGKFCLCLLWLLKSQKSRYLRIKV